VFDETATHILEQIGYPTRRALVHSILPRGIRVAGSPLSASIEIPSQKDRIKTALALFFQVAADISRERKECADIPYEDVAPVLLCDEVSRRYRVWGGIGG
jgi:hypothetical protein